MIFYPNCKINLGLQILNKRIDGYHNLETIFYPIPLHDIIEILPKNNNVQNSEIIECSISGIEIENGKNDNICLKAYNLLKKDFTTLSPIFLHIHKMIPIGAGLGGGSADGSFTLQALNDIYQLGLSKDQLKIYALALGSDCPFFIENVPMFATNRGEVLRKIALNLSEYSIGVYYPNIPINTKWAFQNIEISNHSKSLQEIIQQPIELWKNLLKNDFETPIFSKFPQLKEFKEYLYKNNAIYASLSGSGSGMYGIFKKENEPLIIDNFNNNLINSYYFKET